MVNLKSFGDDLKDTGIFADYPELETTWNRILADLRKQMKNRQEVAGFEPRNREERIWQHCAKDAVLTFKILLGEGTKEEIEKLACEAKELRG